MGTSQQRLVQRLRLLVACLLLAVACAVPRVLLAAPDRAEAVAALVVAARVAAPSERRAAVFERVALAQSARWPRAVAASVASVPCAHASRPSAFDGRHLYLDHCALLC